MSGSWVLGTPRGLAWEKCWEDRAKTLNFCNPGQSWPSRLALVGLHNSNMAFSEILIRDGQTRGKKIKNPFALVVGLNKVQLTFFLPPCYFSLQCRLCSSRSQQDGMQGCLSAAGFPDKSKSLNLGVCGTWSNPDMLSALKQDKLLCCVSCKGLGVAQGSRSLSLFFQVG